MYCDIFYRFLTAASKKIPRNCLCKRPDSVACRFILAAVLSDMDLGGARQVCVDDTPRFSGGGFPGRRGGKRFWRVIPMGQIAKSNFSGVILMG
jgi:hypothetical protein